MRFSFVLPAYKAEFLKSAIDSILAQSYSDFELIIVDDASPEDLFSIVDSYNDERIRFYRNNTNIGGKDLAAQWNHCISFAGGDYIIMASDDDYYDADYLYYMNKLISAYPGLEIYRSSVSVIDKDGKSINDEHFEKDMSMAQKEFFEIYVKGFISGGIPQFVFRKDALILKGGFVSFPLAWFSDDAAVLTLSVNGIGISFRAMFNFRYWGGSISGSRNTESEAKAKIGAGKEFDSFIKNSDVPEDIKLLLAKKIRGVTNGVLNSCSFMVAVKALVYSAKVDSNLYSCSWRVSALADYIVRHTFIIKVARMLRSFRW